MLIPLIWKEAAGATSWFIRLDRFFVSSACLFGWLLRRLLFHLNQFDGYFWFFLRFFLIFLCFFLEECIRNLFLCLRSFLFGQAFVLLCLFWLLRSLLPSFASAWTFGIIKLLLCSAVFNNLCANSGAPAAAAPKIARTANFFFIKQKLLSFCGFSFVLFHIYHKMKHLSPEKGKQINNFLFFHHLCCFKEKLVKEKAKFWRSPLFPPQFRL